MWAFTFRTALRSERPDQRPCCGNVGVEYFAYSFVDNIRLIDLVARRDPDHIDTV